MHILDIRRCFMNSILNVAAGVLLPLLGTTLGASLVFFMKKDLKSSVQKALLGFASGVMIAASVWSLIIPAIEMSEAAGNIPWVPAAGGFMLGVAFLLILDRLIPHIHLNAAEAEGRTSSLGRSSMLVLAVTLHNIPEGMAVGVVFAGVLSGNAAISVAGAFALTIGIAIQNFPEGAVISMPLVGCGLSKKRSFLYGFLSGVVEPVGAVLTILMTSLIEPMLPYILSFAAGAMIYVVVEDLIPESQNGRHSDIATIGVAAGFALMMVLDVALG